MQNKQGVNDDDSQALAADATGAHQTVGHWRWGNDNSQSSVNHWRYSPMLPIDAPEALVATRVWAR